MNSASAAGALWRISAHGQVVDPEGRPLANARVVLRSSINRVTAVDDLRLFDLPDILAETRADDQGRFAFDAVPLGPAARQMVESLEQYHRGAQVVAMADGFGIGWAPLSELATTAEVKVALHPAAAVEGVVQDDAGSPLAGALVEAIAISRFDLGANPLAEKPYNLQLALSAICPRDVTDDQGRFRIEGLPADHLISLWPRHLDHPQKYFLATSVSQPGWQFRQALQLLHAAAQRLIVATQDGADIALAAVAQLAGLDRRIPPPVSLVQRRVKRPHLLFGIRIIRRYRHDTTLPKSRLPADSSLTQRPLLWEVI